MSRFAADRQTQEKVRTYQPQLLREVIRDATNTPHRRGATQKQLSMGTVAQNNWEERKRAQLAALAAKAKAKEEHFQAAMQAKRIAVAAEREAAFESMYGEVLSGLENAAGIMGDVQEELDHATKAHRQKQEQLYAEWSAEVFDKIQSRIHEAVSKRSIRDMETRLQQASDAYIHATNTKLGVFRDVIIPEDYDPLAPLHATIKVVVSDIQDPIKKDLQRAEEERQLLRQAEAVLSPTGTHGRSMIRSGRRAGTLSPRGDDGFLGKQTLDATLWGAQQIGATPYCHCIDKRTGEYVTKRADPMANAQRESHVVDDHFAAPPALPPPRFGKRVGGEVAKGGRHDLFDVLSGSCKEHPEVTGGDRWLEQKGKRAVAEVERPEVKHLGKRVGNELHPDGRKDLHDVISHTCHQHPEVTGGDSWLEQRGKRFITPSR